MNTITLRAESVRITVQKGSGFEWKAENDRLTSDEKCQIISSFLTPHRIANSILVISGENPVAWQTRNVWKPSSSVYNEIVSLSPDSIKLNVESAIREVCTVFKGDGKNTLPAQCGTFDKRWFECAYFKMRGQYNSNLIDEFHSWLAGIFPNNETGSFPSLMRDFESLAIQTISKHGTLEDWVLNFLPVKYHCLGPLLMDSYYTTATKAKRSAALAAGKPALSNDNSTLSKHVTRPFFFRPGQDEMFIANGNGNVVQVGGPRYVVRTDLEIEISLSDDEYGKTMRAIEGDGSPGYATLGDGGLCWIKTER